MLSKNKMTPSEADCFSSSRPSPAGSWQFVLTGFIVVLLLVSNLVSFSHYPELNKDLRPYMRPIRAATGLETLWQLFAPDLRLLNFHNTAIVTFQDGSTRLYEFPRFGQMGTVSEFRHYKLLKLFNDYMSNPVGSAYRPSIARYLANSVNEPDNPAVMVVFVFNFIEVPEPDRKNWIYQARLPRHTKKDSHFVYRIRSNDLLPINIVK